ncbi:hypothetical protein E1A91_D03G184800v1 [Gossypium mustelinum]|uniref:Uncharacterized protein n=1 Tax=Gossypium mustelinum TaxID=34275 RepID=A0A5D2VPY4_GOSMU|nr:hypothetical protein E1A91_D03G184800v1 [Gossypium mustelinum]
MNDAKMKFNIQLSPIKFLTHLTYSYWHVCRTCHSFNFFNELSILSFANYKLIGSSLFIFSLISSFILLFTCSCRENAILLLSIQVYVPGLSD